MPPPRDKKRQDVAELRRKWNEFEKLVSPTASEGIDERGNEITFFVSTALSDAKNAKKNQVGAVALDRRLKFARRCGRKALAKFRVAQVHANGKEHERVLGDLCRYLAVAADIPRIDRAPNQSERAEQIEWVCRAVEHYDMAMLSSQSYAQALRKMLYAGDKPLVAFVLVARHRLKARGSNDVLVQSLEYVRECTSSVGILGKLLLCALLEKLDDVDASTRRDIESDAEQALGHWKALDPSDVSDEVARLAIIAVAFVGRLLAPRKSMQLGRIVLAPALYKRATEARFREEDILNDRFSKFVWDKQLSKTFAVVYDARLKMKR